MPPVSVIGMGLSLDDLTSYHLDLIQDADILIGAKRHLACFKDAGAEKKEITGDIKGVIDFIRISMKNKIVVLASGDPLYYGIGSLLIKSLGKENVNIYPNITSVAAVFARIKEPWNDAYVISMHGRNSLNELLSALEREDKIALFTDPRNNPSMVARLLLDNGISEFEICVLERLGNTSERIAWYEPVQAAKINFADPNMVVLKRRQSEIIEKDDKSPALDPYLGMPEHLFCHQQGLITKSEVRAVTISRLRLLTDHILWDLGAGSGSISIEASLFIKKGRIFALEKEPDRIKQIEKNKKKFCVTNLIVQGAKLPEGLKELPAPDRIFIGGGGRDLEKIIRAAITYLKVNGIVVINTVLLQNIELAFQTLNHAGFKTDIIGMQINRGRKMPWGNRFEAQNPVWIITGERIPCGAPTLEHGNQAASF